MRRISVNIQMKSRWLHIFVVIFLAISVYAQDNFGEQIKDYADRYSQCVNASERMKLANSFFDFLYHSDYIDEQIVFPADSHIDSVDVNVYFYIAEYYYNEGEYRASVYYCTRALGCMGVVDDISKSDVYSLLGASYFRMSEFDRAIEALNECYIIDKSGDDIDRMSSTLNGIASAFVASGRPRDAEKYILEAIAANGLTDNLSRRAVLYGTASEMYKAMGDGKKSLSYARKALQIEEQLGDNAKIGIRLSQVANAEISLSMIKEAQQDLSRAIPLLYNSGNYHSWGICQNQMGDILAAEGKNAEAALCYRGAAELFFKQGDKYNEMHAREGLCRVIKSSLPNEAMMHLERAKQLRDSIYQTETGEAISKYNAIYYNDILQKENNRVKQEKRTVLSVSIIIAVLLLAVMGFIAYFTFRRYKLQKINYEQNINSLQSQYNEVNRLYNNVVADTMLVSANLTDDDKLFLNKLVNVIDTLSEQGISDIETVASQMHVNIVTLRRRLAKTVSMTPQAYILQVRMQKAKYLLQNYRDITIAEVSDKCGYSQVANFTRAFTRYYGITPTQARVQKD